MAKNSNEYNEALGCTFRNSDGNIAVAPASGILNYRASEIEVPYGKVFQDAGIPSENSAVLLTAINHGDGKLPADIPSRDVTGFNISVNALKNVLNGICSNLTGSKVPLANVDVGTALTMIGRKIQNSSTAVKELFKQSNQRVESGDTSNPSYLRNVVKYVAASVLAGSIAIGGMFPVVNTAHAATDNDYTPVAAQVQQGSNASWEQQTEDKINDILAAMAASMGVDPDQLEKVRLVPTNTPDNDAKSDIHTFLNDSSGDTHMTNQPPQKAGNTTDSSMTDSPLHTQSHTDEGMIEGLRPISQTIANVNYNDIFAGMIESMQNSMTQDNNASTRKPEVQQQPSVVQQSNTPTPQARAGSSPILIQPVVDGRIADFKPDGTTDVELKAIKANKEEYLKRCGLSTRITSVLNQLSATAKKSELSQELSKLYNDRISAPGVKAYDINRQFIEFYKEMHKRYNTSKNSVHKDKTVGASFYNNVMVIPDKLMKNILVNGGIQMCNKDEFNFLVTTYAKQKLYGKAYTERVDIKLSEADMAKMISSDNPILRFGAIYFKHGDLTTAMAELNGSNMSKSGMELKFKDQHGKPLEKRYERPTRMGEAEMGLDPGHLLKLQEDIAKELGNVAESTKKFAYIIANAETGRGKVLSNNNSSATGIYQFTDETYLETVRNTLNDPKYAPLFYKMTGLDKDSPELQKLNNMNSKDFNKCNKHKLLAELPTLKKVHYDPAAQTLLFYKKCEVDGIGKQPLNSEMDFLKLYVGKVLKWDHNGHGSHPSAVQYLSEIEGLNSIDQCPSVQRYQNGEARFQSNGKPLLEFTKENVKSAYRDGMAAYSKRNSLINNSRQTEEGVKKIVPLMASFGNNNPWMKDIKATAENEQMAQMRTRFVTEILPSTQYNLQIYNMFLHMYENCPPEAKAAFAVECGIQHSPLARVALSNEKDEKIIQKIEESLASYHATRQNTHDEDVRNILSM